MNFHTHHDHAKTKFYEAAVWGQSDNHVATRQGWDRYDGE